MDGKGPFGGNVFKNPASYINVIMSIKYTIQHNLHLISEGSLLHSQGAAIWNDLSLRVFLVFILGPCNNTVTCTIGVHLVRLFKILMKLQI